jgi:ribosomal protein S18 acetylase RimI-like enzyme
MVGDVGLVQHDAHARILSVHPLDNPVWHALTGPQATVAEGDPPALRYRREYAPFSALPDQRSSGAWDALAALTGPGRVAVLFADGAEPPAGWDEVFAFPTIQMVAASVAGAPCADAVSLGPDDVPAMADLVARTQPGPFAERTIELGDYLGVRDGDGTLVAMAGERMHLPGYSEISAVCTDPTHQGRGLATALVLDLAARITARGDTPMLHVVASNENAIRLYLALGFEVRREGTVLGLRTPT